MSVSGDFSKSPAARSLQDWADGEALRRLREALPRLGYTAGMLVEAEVDWWRVEVRGPSREVVAIETGATIAEAADKCREAIGRALEGNG